MTGRFEVLWARITRVISFFMGLGIMGYETIGDRSDRPWLYAAAVGMMGLPIARAAENILGKFGGTSTPTSLPGDQSDQPVDETIQ